MMHKEVSQILQEKAVPLTMEYAERLWNVRHVKTYKIQITEREILKRTKALSVSAFFFRFSALDKIYGGFADLGSCVPAFSVSNRLLRSTHL